MIDLHNKGCVCFTCQRVAEFKFRPGDVLESSDKTLEHWGELKVVGLTIVPVNGAKRVIYTRAGYTHTWDFFKSLGEEIVAGIDDDARNLDHWYEHEIVRYFKLKEK